MFNFNGEKKLLITKQVITVKLFLNLITSVVNYRKQPQYLNLSHMYYHSVQKYLKFHRWAKVTPVYGIQCRYFKKKS